ncbi:DEKNAAC101237 [Brettanomyces naardenensis]|uniref:DEKNAAC101237 n=1 Tax=Brettanomyces naardenensis TaxID=13370 RepID=A0A448YHN1_BRENA|nr:DEKNAAC101237 [Brettanomyces naardenensis]
MSTEKMYASSSPDGAQPTPKMELPDNQVLVATSIHSTVQSQGSADTSRKDKKPKKNGKVSTKIEKSTKRKSDFEESPERSFSKRSKEEDAKHSHPPAGHRPVTSCTHCRQHKIKCNASERFPRPCSRCERMDLKCEIDPEFRPKKGSQIQSLRNDVDELRSKIELLTKNENLIAEALRKTNPNPLQAERQIVELPKQMEATPIEGSSSMSFPTTGSSTSLNQQETNISSTALPQQVVTPINTKPLLQTVAPDAPITEFCLGDVKISLEKAIELHSRFVEIYLPYMPIMVSDDPVQLYRQSQLLFWTVMLTACLSDPEPGLYISLASLIKQLAIETCWIRTPRSTHIVQALLILGTWPLPNQKVLDDCSYRFVGLAKCLSMQLGLHRGKFIQEFSRTQVALKDAETWRTRTWLAVFFSEQFWSSNLGLPPSLRADYLLEKARLDQSLPKNFRCLISLAIFQSKLMNVMGLSVTSPDGLMEPRNRDGALAILERELERLVFKLQIDDSVVEIYYLYVKLMICLFAFLPETPSEDQIKYVTEAYMAATRIVTLMSKLLETRQLTEYPIYVRHSVTTAAFVLFRLHLTPYLLPKYVDSARQSVVTVHRLFRNMLAAWKDVMNDISRTATVLEKLNFVIITHPELFTENEGIIIRMRSHLTGSLFYDLVWNIHEARRRFIIDSQNKKDGKPAESEATKEAKKKVLPLPFYNQITKDDFKAMTTTTPDGTTVTVLVPTDQAITNAKASASAAGLSKPKQINGIPLAMLGATGSMKAFGSQPPQSPTDHTKPKRISGKARGRKPKKKKEPDMDASSVAFDGMPATVAMGSSVSGTSMAAGVNGMVPPPLFPNSTGYNPNSSNGISTVGSSSSSNTPTNSYSTGHTPSENQDIFNNDMFIDSIFQQQGRENWMENGDDLLGWFDMNMSPEF